MANDILKAEKLYYEAVEALTRSNPAKAQAKLEEAVTLNPQDPLIFEALGVTYKILDTPSQALEAFQKVLALNPECLSAYKQMVQIYLSLEEENKALELLLQWEKTARRLLEQDVEDLDHARSLAECLFTMDEVDEAVTIYHQIIEANPYDLDSYLGLADIFFETAAYEEVEGVCTKALEFFPDNASLHLTLGLSYNYRNLIARAIKELTVAYDLNPDLRELPGLIEKLAELKKALGNTVEEIITESKPIEFLTGFISWYDEEEGIGFIRPEQDDEDYLLHFSALVDPEYTPRKSDKVRFGIENYPQGKLAVQVSLTSEEANLGKRKTGLISVLDRDKGFGAVTCNGEDLLFFISHIQEDDKESLKQGDAVNFAISETTDLDDKPIKRAVDIKKVNS